MAFFSVIFSSDLRLGPAGRGGGFQARISVSMTMMIP